mmetsp:Transcript_12989/g.17093  ORF Transcript_12989/g.17093 Transcript_12989/m.17093 type:complete len:101 (+) Transcript_12989:22-324(+)
MNYKAGYLSGTTNKHGYAYWHHAAIAIVHKFVILKKLKRKCQKSRNAMPPWSHTRLRLTVFLMNDAPPKDKTLARKNRKSRNTSVLGRMGKIRNGSMPNI